MSDQSITVELKHEFDAARCRHYLNDQLSVLHCHHYATLYTQLAMDAEFIDAKIILAQSAEDTFFDMLSGYYQAHSGLTPDEKLEVGCQYYAAIGLGQMKVLSAGETSGEIVLEHSHLDEGWIKKWDKYDQVVNFLTCGYVAALFATAYGKAARSYAVSEVEGIVTGAEKSRFVVKVN
jgi:hypothetical protein